MSSDATSDLGTQVEAARLAALSQIASATDTAMVTKIGSELSGKKSALNTLRASLGKIQDPEARKVAGQLINESAQQVEAALLQRTQEFLVQERAAQVAGEALDLTEFVTANRRGHSHIVTQAMQRLEDVFIGLGFQVAEGPEVETDFYNFEALNMPRTHPARSEFDTMFIEPFSSEHEANTVLLRTHTSPVQIRVMQSWEPPIYAIMPGRVFRRDTPDATHMPVFHQIEGLVIDRDITFAHLAGIIESFTKAFFGSEFTSRLRPSFFPFTEPSAEFDIKRPNGDWIELGGCGMVHPNVLRAGGIDPDEYTGFAFGFGIDRMAKERHNVEDIREMYTNDLRFLRQFS
ncbi:MAG: phenylalanine--tRNA ligase subunit alpha [Actinobacteria bacterium]|uniref:Phenylalanine--tRNA ligase alpha subunit n=1 Tax=freshwater metagenome TaxID=449393 RepID=A0A6J6XN33_9ZZZZ|nr:phenylalanine--tRNA ligase subunit alpha [Actinomycetota bacterium]